MFSASPIFINNHHKEKFDHLQQIPVKSGSKVDLDSLCQYSSYSSLISACIFQNCYYLFKLSSSSFKNYIQLFYANFQHNNGECSTLIQNESFNFNASSIANIIHHPLDGVDISNQTLDTFQHFTNNHSIQDASILLYGEPNSLHKTKLTSLTSFARVMATLLGHTIYPQQVGSRHITPSLQLLTYCFLAKIKVNIPSFIISQMIEIVNNPKVLFYGKIISNIIFEDGMYDLRFFLPCEKLPNDKTFGYSSIQSLRLKDF